MQCSWETCEHHEHVLNEFEHLCIRVWPHSWMQSVNAITLFTECIWFWLDFFVLLFIILWGIWMLECAQYATVAKCVLNCTACVHCVVLYIHICTFLTNNGYRHEALQCQSCDLQPGDLGTFSQLFQNCCHEKYTCMISCILDTNYTVFSFQSPLTNSHTILYVTQSCTTITSKHSGSID